MATQPIDISTFSPVPSENSIPKEHPVDRGQLSSYPGFFLRKKMESAKVAYLELLAQEFFRLIIPYQPLTLLAHNSAENSYYVLSEEVKGYRPLPVNKHQRFAKGEYTGLGRVMITAVFLYEIDLKNGNVCIDAANRVIKIDGDWCFACIRDGDFSEKLKPLSSRLLTTLPFPSGYYSYNWLDIVMYGINRPGSSIVDARIISAPHFRQEINETLLQLLTLPESFIRRFVYAYVPIEHSPKVFIDFLITRRDELHRLVFESRPFIGYVVSDAANICFFAHLRRLNEFSTGQKKPIISVLEQNTLTEEAQSLFNNLVAQAERPLLLERLDALHQALANVQTEKQLELEYQKLLKIIPCIDSLTNQQNPELNQKNWHDFKASVHTKKMLLEAKHQSLAERFRLLDKIQFYLHYKKFVSKQLEMTEKSKHNLRYQNSLPSAEALCASLEQEKIKFLHNPINSKDATHDFLSNCKQTVATAKIALANHREWLGDLRNFFITLLAFLTMGFSEKYLGIFAKTDSVVQLEAFEAILHNPN